MTRPGLRIGVFVFLCAGMSLNAGAGQRQHKPWLMIHTKSSRTPPAIEAPMIRVVQPSPIGPNLPARTNTGRSIANQAISYQGTRYRFGGSTKKGMDCSGLVNRIYDDLKLKNLPRSSQALYSKGNPVKLEDLQPGDLVFFKNTYRRGISHVGVYAGSNRFVHAANHRHGVTVTSMSDPYYQLHYAGARRLY